MCIKIIVTCLMGPGTLEAKLIPLSKSNLVSKIIVLRREIGPSIKKVEYIKLPVICRNSFFNLIITPILLIYYTKKNNIDLILSYHFIPHAFFAYIASVFSRTPYNISQTGLYIQKYTDISRYRKIIIYFLKKSSFINVPGTKSKKFWVSKGIPGGKINIIHSTINTNNFKPDKYVTKKYDFLILSRLAPEKQINKLIKILKKLKEDNCVFKAIIVGDGPQKKQLENQVNNSGLNNMVLFTGFKENTVDYFRKSKIFLMYSNSEGLPTALMQAMSCGLITFSTNVGNISDVIIHNHTGFIYPVNQWNSYYNHVKKVFQNINMYNYIRENSREIIVKNHSYNSAKSKWDYVLNNFK